MHTRVMVNCSIENVETVTDKAEYRTRSVSAREVGWQTCPGVLFIGTGFRIRIQVMASLIGRQHEVQVSAELGEGRVPTITLPANSVMNPDYDKGKYGDELPEQRIKKNTDHVKKNNRGELAMAEWGKKNKLLTA
jgi:hypothetical protein